MYFFLAFCSIYITPKIIPKTFVDRNVKEPYEHEKDAL
jgi:hypothetical protein